MSETIFPDLQDTVRPLPLLVHRCRDKRVHELHAWLFYIVYVHACIYSYIVHVSVADAVLQYSHVIPSLCAASGGFAAGFKCIAIGLLAWITPAT